jgi:predicted RNA binding protein YcfA (HicA-like mRNA interferase family)
VISNSSSLPILKPSNKRLEQGYPLRSEFASANGIGRSEGCFPGQRAIPQDERRDVNSRKLLQKALSSPENLRFGEVCALARAFGFHLSRVSGSHHIFARQDVRELVNLQDVGGKAKPYPVKQLLDLVERYNLSIGGEE